MNISLRNALMAASVAAGLALLVVSGPSVHGQSPPSDKKSKFVTADATEVKEAQEQKQKASDEMAAALPKLRGAEKSVRETRQGGVESLGVSPQEREARQRELARREDELRAAKLAISEATFAHTRAKRTLANLEARVAASQTQPNTSGQPRVTDQPPGAGPGARPQSVPRFRNALGDLKSHLGPTYYWVERINIVSQGAKNDTEGPLPPEEFVRRNPQNAPGATVDPYDVLIRNIQEEYDRGPKVVHGSPVFKPRIPPVIVDPGKTPTSPPKSPPMSGAAANPALQAQIARQREKVRQLRRQADTDVISPQTTRIRRELEEAEQELQRLESQLNRR